MIIANNSRALLSSQIHASKNDQYISVSDIVSEKQKKIHEELYNRALSRFKAEYPEYTTDISDDSSGVKKYSTVIFTERLSDKGYDKPSHVIMTQYSVQNVMEDIDIPPVVRYDIDLTPWWDEVPAENNNISGNSNNKKTCKFKEWSDWSNCECVYKDYINDKVRVYNRIDHWTKEIPMSMLNSINNAGQYYIPDSEQQNIIKSGSLFTTMWKDLHPEKYNG